MSYTGWMYGQFERLFFLLFALTNSKVYNATVDPDGEFPVVGIP